MVLSGIVLLMVAAALIAGLIATLMSWYRAQRERPVRSVRPLVNTVRLVEPLGQDDYAALLHRDEDRRRARFEWAPTLSEDDYAALLHRDEDRRRARFEWAPTLSERYGEAPRIRTYMWRCAVCGERCSELRIVHPIWDGPFEDAGSGSVDLRDVPVCVRCLLPGELLELGLDPREPSELRSSMVGAGRPIRLPYHGRALTGEQIPIQLLPELFERMAFHNLPVPVARVKLPPPAPPPAPVSGVGPHAHVPCEADPETCFACGRPRNASEHV